MADEKNPIIALIVSLLFSFIGLCGIGQIYAGRLQRGIGVLIGGWIIAGIATFLAFTIVGICVSIPLAFIYMIWQAYDAYSLAKEYNERLQKDGKAPW